MKILVINAGSSSLKYQLIDMENSEVLAKGNCERIGIDGKFTHKAKGDEYCQEVALPDHAAAIKLVLQFLTDEKWGVIKDASEIAAVGHRVVNGGEVFYKATLMDDEKLDTLETLTEFAPLHNPAAVTGIRACVAVMGKEVPQVTVYDTAFHYGMPKVAALYALPYELYEKHGVRRFGAHGTSHDYVAHECAKFLGKDIKDLKIITCHLGNGSSISAVKGGKCIDTSMGFTPLAGVMMGTRTGDMDPAVVTYLMDKLNLDAKGVNNLMNKESGVFGISGGYSDFRDLEKYAAEGNERCQLALDMFNYQVSKYVGAYAAAMGGVDAIVFTAGIGENTELVRKAVCESAAYLGAKLDEEKNRVKGQKALISTPDSKVALCVIPTNEELAIARQTLEVISE